MEYRVGYESNWIDAVLEMFNRTETMRRSNREKLDRAFAGSFGVVSAWERGRLIGIGRLISDGAAIGGIYDLVVDPDFQKRGIGQEIIQRLMNLVPEATFHLTSTFGHEEFYLKQGFLKHKTAMAKYPVPSAYLDSDWKPR